MQSMKAASGCRACHQGSILHLLNDCASVNGTGMMSLWVVGSLAVVAMCSKAGLAHLGSLYSTRYRSIACQSQQK